MNSTTSRCHRPGCGFNRRIAVNKEGKSRRRLGCSTVCEIWLSRARRIALSGGPEAESAARALLHLSALLDARTYAAQEVPEFFETLPA